MFSENLKVVKNEFAPAMDFAATKSLKVSNIFDAIEELEKGKYNTLQEMYKANNFNAQNKVFQAVNTMLTSLGTPISSLTKKTKKAKLSGTDFALNILAKNGLNVSKTKTTSVTNTTSNEVEYEDAVSL